MSPLVDFLHSLYSVGLGAFLKRQAPRLKYLYTTLPFGKTRDPEGDTEDLARALYAGPSLQRVYIMPDPRSVIESFSDFCVLSRWYDIFAMAVGSCSLMACSAVTDYRIDERVHRRFQCGQNKPGTRLVIAFIPNERV